MKIAILTQHFYPFDRPSGAISLIREIVDELIRQSHSVLIICSKKKKEHAIYQYNSCTVYKHNLFQLISTRKVIGQYSPDKIYVCSSLSNFSFSVIWAYIINLVLGTKNMIFYQLVNFNPTKQRYIYKDILKRYSNIFVASNKIKQYLSYCHPYDPVVLLPAVNLSRSVRIKNESKNNGSFIIGFVGHISYLKGIDRFLYIVKQLPQFNFLLIAGSSKDPNDAILEKQILKSNLPNLTALNFIENPLFWIAKCKIILLPYRTGSSVLGVAQSAVESMSMGIPVIGTDNSALNSLIVTNVNGLLLNNVDEIIENIEKLSDNKKIYRNLSSQAIHDIKKYSDISNLVQSLNKGTSSA